jgi:hypothetical protein
LKRYWVSALVPLNPMLVTIMLILKGNLMKCRKLIAFTCLMMNDWLSESTNATQTSMTIDEMHITFMSRNQMPPYNHINWFLILPKALTQITWQTTTKESFVDYSKNIMMTFNDYVTNWIKHYNESCPFQPMHLQFMSKSTIFAIIDVINLCGT